MSGDDDLFEATRRRVTYIESLRARGEALFARDEDAEEAFARGARSGELGRDWQVLQGRIDLGETSREAVFDGSDDSAAAQGVREAARSGVARLAEELRAEAEAAGEPDPAEELALERERLLARGAALRERIARMGGMPQ
ncbi:hypothetical protein [Microbacterium trichothecenolyticum]|uniref:Uncharacterized protein n=1 Tax=Microbacterium trichothecenolyticum TaxID=69370 RepID=A0ABU0TVV6_MICTR|nr:hypothetical protein [Microbacterium trichothecenolyticum]MDQ1123064.1 hypothetical protein [Microbacterium trichothecenolyticum]